MKTLILNASYEPLAVVSWKRAITLVLQGRAEVVHEGKRAIRAEHTTRKVPSVIKLKEFVRIPRKKVMVLNRRAVLARDRHQCQFTHCNSKGTTIDHVHPTSKGGTNTWENVVAACRKCNFKKADKSLKEMGWKLKRQPKPPGPQYIFTGSNELPEWGQYLRPGEGS